MSLMKAKEDDNGAIVGFTEAISNEDVEEGKAAIIMIAIASCAPDLEVRTSEKGIVLVERR